MATVLVVDDRPAHREIARAVLDYGGHRVIEAEEGEQGLALAQHRQPDAVVLDMLMPGMDGYEFIHKLRANPETAAIPVLFYTSNYRADEVQPIARAYGVNRVLLKSADPRELLDAVDSAIRERPRVSAGTVDEPSWQHLRMINAKLLENVRALDESNTQLVAIAEQSPVGILLSDPTGCATYVNARLEEITGLPAEELLGHGWLRCVNPGHREEIRTAMADRSSIRRYRDLVTCPLGDRWLHTLLSAVQNSDGSLLGYLGNIDDVTDIITAEHHRRAVERTREAAAHHQVTQRLERLTRLADGVAHDFETLLGAVLAQVESAKNGVQEATGGTLDDDRGAEIRQHLDQIAQAGRRAAHLAHQLLAFDHQESVADLDAVVQEVH